MNGRDRTWSHASVTDTKRAPTKRPISMMRSSSRDLTHAHSGRSPLTASPHAKARHRMSTVSDGELEEEGEVAVEKLYCVFCASSSK